MPRAPLFPEVLRLTLLPLSPSTASIGAGKLKARFENIAKASDEENRKRAEEERARRQARDSKERELARRRQEVGTVRRSPQNATGGRQ